MDLALLVYGIAVLANIGVVSAIIATFGAFLAIGASIGYFSSYYESEQKTAVRFFKYSVIALSLVVPILIVIPSEKTMYTMVGAYAAQKVAEDPRVQNLSAKVLKVVEDKLDSYIEEPKK